jgi:hypothetical protein
MNRLFMRNHVVSLSIILFMITFCLVRYLAPSMLYDKNGQIRKFGIGYKEKTVIPVWLFSLIISVLSYVAVRYYID